MRNRYPHFVPIFEPATQIQFFRFTSGSGRGTTSSSIQSTEEQLLQRSGWCRRPGVELTKRRSRQRRWWWWRIGWRHANESNSTGFAAQWRQQLRVGERQFVFGWLFAARPLLTGGRLSQRRRPHFTRHSGSGSKSRLHYSSQGNADALIMISWYWSMFILQCAVHFESLWTRAADLRWFMVASFTSNSINLNSDQMNNYPR